jgi:hypothetical protein
MNKSTLIGLAVLGLVGFYLYKSKKVKESTPSEEPFVPAKDIIVPPPTTDCKILGTCVVTPKEVKGRANKRAKLLEYNGKFVTGTYPDGRTFDGVLTIEGDNATIVSQSRSSIGINANVDDLQNVFVTTESGEKKYIYGVPYIKGSKFQAMLTKTKNAPREIRVD